MKAIVYNKYGGIDALHLKEVDVPTPKDDEVLVRNYAVSINDWDYGLLQGDLLNRLMSGLTKPRRQILGSDIAGRVEAVGKSVTKFKVGDDVYGDLSGRWGGFAEYTCAPERSLGLKPAGMSYIDAAAIPQAGMLAVQGLIDKGNIQNGYKVLINGAGGGVGTFGVQIAKQYDVEVTGVDSADKLEMMRNTGFDHVLDYRKEDFTRSGKQYDLVLDAKTDRSVFAYARALTPKGRYVTVGGKIGKLLQSLLLKPIVRLGSKKKYVLVMLKPNKDLEYMSRLYETNKMKPVIDGPYSVDNFKEAFRKYDRARHLGKVVITF